MDLFRLGLRNILGITMPGALLVLILCYVLLSVLYFLNQPLKFLSSVKDSEFLIAGAFFLVSYILGSLMRLNAADKLDEKSGKYFRKRYSEDLLRHELKKPKTNKRYGEWWAIERFKWKSLIKENKQKFETDAKEFAECLTEASKTMPDTRGAMPKKEMKSKRAMTK
jgi:hypothetical protein